MIRFVCKKVSNVPLLIKRYKKVTRWLVLGFFTTNRENTALDSKNQQDHFLDVREKTNGMNNTIQTERHYLHCGPQ